MAESSELKVFLRSLAIKSDREIYSQSLNSDDDDANVFYIDYQFKNYGFAAHDSHIVNTSKLIDINRMIAKLKEPKVVAVKLNDSHSAFVSINKIQIGNIEFPYSAINKIILVHKKLVDDFD